MAGAPWSRARWRRSASWASAAWPSPASSRAAPSSTASSTSPRPRRSPTWSRPRPTSSASWRCSRWMARCIASTRIGARSGLRTLAHLEAAIDFPDEDLPAGIADEVRAGITQLQAEIAAHLDDRRGERLREGLSHRHHRAAQRRQVLAAQSSGAARRGHRVGDRRHDARRHRSPSRSRRLAGGAGRHRGPARSRATPSSRRACAAPGRAPRRPTCACWCSMPRATGRARCRR